MAPAAHEPHTATVPEAAHQAGLLRTPVIGLRVIGSAVEHQIPASESPITIGSADDRSIRLSHPSVSRLHAQIERRGDHLLLIDCDSKNGCYSDGERRAVIHLVPGGRIRIGEVELVAYSHESDRVRRVFQRYLGYDRPAQRAVEDAHHAASRLRHLALLGPPGAGSVAFARSIHKHTVGAPWPLVVTPRLCPDRDAQRLAQCFRADYAEQKRMLHAAGHGTLVLSFADLPDDPGLLLDSIQRRESGTRVIFLGGDGAQLGLLGALASNTVVIRVPALAARRHEVSWIVTDTFLEHVGAKGVSPAILTAHDYECLFAHDWPGNHDEVAEVVTRLTAIRTHGKIRRAARALGLSPSTLSEWKQSYGFRLERRSGQARRSRAG
jgi:Inner membrane component of T3SS, cytoplasmic domain